MAFTKGITSTRTFPRGLAPGQHCPCEGTGVIEHSPESLELCGCRVHLAACPECSAVVVHPEDHPDGLCDKCAERLVCSTCGKRHPDLAVVSVTNGGDLWMECRVCRFSAHGEHRYTSFGLTLTRAFAHS